MTKGRLIAAVGPSGVGKDSVMAGLLHVAPWITPVRRTITRRAVQGGEIHDTLTTTAFAAKVTQGAFCLHWGAHGLFYGIPVQVKKDVDSGAICLANLSRGALADAAALFPALTVLNITASPAVLAARLAARGRETGAEIENRLARTAPPLPDGLHVIDIRNDGPLDQTVAQAVAALQPVRG